MNLLFDLDGTLADPFRAIYSSLAFGFQKNGQAPPDLELVRKAIGPPMQNSLVDIFGLEPELAKKVFADFRLHHAEHCVIDYQLYEGTEKALKELSKNHRLFVATSKPTRFTLPIMERFKLSSLFVGIYGSELDGTRSAKTDLIAYILSEQNLDPGSTVMIGDRKHDAIGAINNNVRPFGVLWGYGSKDELVEAGTSAQFENWDALVESFKRLS